MSDFDDDETTGDGGTTPPADDGKPPAARRGPNDPPAKASRPADDDDGWDDEPVARRRRPADDDWDDDWDDDDRAPGGRRDLTIIFAIIAAAAVIVLAVVLTNKKSSNNTATPPAGTTPGQVESSTTAGNGGLCPGWEYNAGGDGHAVAAGHGVYIWSGIIKGKDDGHGSTNAIHVRNNNVQPVVVSVSAPDAIKVVSKGNATVTPDTGTQLTLNLPAGDGSDGVDLNIDCNGSPASFTVTMGGVPVKADQIKIGDSSTADENPVKLTRS